MENFKVNHYERENRAEEFETFSLEHLNYSPDLTRAEKAEIELQHEQSRHENREEIISLFEKIEDSGRDKSGILENRAENFEEAAHWGDYGASFARYEGREGFTARPNLNRSQAQLSAEISQIKASVRKTSMSQKASNFMRSMGFGKV